jgi:hypothetical protein
LIERPNHLRARREWPCPTVRCGASCDQRQGDPYKDENDEDDPEGPSVSFPKLPRVYGRWTGVGRPALIRWQEREWGTGRGEQRAVECRRVGVGHALIVGDGCVGEGEAGNACG